MMTSGGKKKKESKRTNESCDFIEIEREHALCFNYYVRTSTLQLVGEQALDKETRAGN